MWLTQTGCSSLVEILVVFLVLRASKKKNSELQHHGFQTQTGFPLPTLNYNPRQWQMGAAMAAPVFFVLIFVVFFVFGVARGSSMPWVAKLQGDRDSECKLSNAWSRGCREIKLLLSARHLS